MYSFLHTYTCANKIWWVEHPWEEKIHIEWKKFGMGKAKEFSSWIPHRRRDFSQCLPSYSVYCIPLWHVSFTYLARTCNTHSCACLFHKGTSAIKAWHCNCLHPNGKGEKSTRTASACLLHHTDILLDEVKGAEGYREDAACGAISHHKEEAMEAM